MLAKTAVDELEVREHQRVIFRVSDNTWLEAIMRHVVPPREAGRIKARLIKKFLAALNAEPDRVMFPRRHESLEECKIPTQTEMQPRLSF